MNGVGVSESQSRVKRGRMMRRRRTQAEVKRILERAFRAEFPADTVDITNGYRGNIHVVVVSRRFDRMPSDKRADLLFQIIDKTELTDEEKTRVSLVMPVTPEAIKRGAPMSA